MAAAAAEQAPLIHLVINNGGTHSIHCKYNTVCPVFIHSVTTMYIVTFYEDNCTINRRLLTKRKDGEGGLNDCRAGRQGEREHGEMN